jgi:hypothetical protein
VPKCRVHGFGRNQDVHDRFLGSVDDRVVQGIDVRIAEHLDRDVLFTLRALSTDDETPVAGSKRDHEVSARVLTNTPGPGNSESRAPYESIALMRKQRRIRRDDDDDRALPRGELTDLRQRHDVVADVRADRESVDTQPIAPPVVGLDEHPYSEAVGVHARGGPEPPLNSWQIIPVPPPTFPSSTGAP